jgi:hypothetical protein
MKTLYESILSNTKTKVETARTDIDNLKYFGGHFRFVAEDGLFRESDMSIISIKALTKLTKGMKFKNPQTEAAMKKGFIHHSDKLEKFALWMDNLDISELDITDFSVCDVKLMSKLWPFIREKMIEDGLFNKPKIITTNAMIVTPTRFTISIHKKIEWSRLFIHFELTD